MPTGFNCEFARGENLKGVCFGCTGELKGRRTRWCSDACAKLFYKNHMWTDARKAARRRDKYKCRTCESKEKLEVNHIVPRIGKGYGVGCWNHLTNLETLCHVCHVKVTNAQRKARNG